MGFGTAGKIHAYARLMRVDRPVGTLLLLWPTLAALWLAAEGVPPLGILAAFVAGTFLARSAGCVVNDIADRNVDGHVERTRDRPLPAGTVTLAEAVTLLAALSALCLAVAMTLNAPARWFAVAGAGIAAAYPFLKRWTHWPQAALGVAFSWGIPMAFAAVNGTTNVIAWLLFGASLLWIVAYDTIYAMVDRDDDLIVGIKSTAILFGHADRAVIGVLQLATIGVLVGVGAVAGLADGWYYGVAVALGLFVFQQRLIRDRDRDACFKAFGNNVWVGFALFAGAVAEFGTTGFGAR